MGGWFFGAQSSSVSSRAIASALDSGINAFDTAPVYGFGRAEEILGAALGNRGFVAGKCGLVFDESGEFFFETDYEGRAIRVHRNLTAAAVSADCERSLQRLRRDRIDLYQIHWPLAPSRLADAHEALLRLKAQGKIGGIGICNCTAEHLAAFERSTGQKYDSVQMRLSLVHKSGSQQVLAYARKHRIPFLAYGSLAQGALLGRRLSAPDDMRASLALFGDEWQARIAGAWNEAGVASDMRARAALESVLSLPGVSAVIAGIRNEAQAVENAKAGEGGTWPAVWEAFRDLDFRGK